MSDDRHALSASGEWWLPDQPTERRSGTVTYGPGRFPVLEILQGWHDPPETVGPSDELFRRLDSFEPVRPGQSQNVFDRAVVHGTTLDLKPITLLQAFDYPGAERIGGSSGAVHKRRIEASILVVGAHVDALDALPVRKLILVHSCSSLMLANSGLKQVVWDHAPDTDGRGFDIAWREQQPLIADLQGNVKLRLSSAGSMSPSERSGDGQTVRLSTEAQITLSSDAPRDFLSLWEEFAAPLDALVRFASNWPGGWRAVTVVSDTTSVQVFHRGLVAGDIGRVPLRHQPTFYLDRLSSDFTAAVCSWLEVMAEHGSAVQQGLNATELETSAEKVRQLAMALEALADSSDFVSPLREHWSSLKEAIKGAIPGEQHASVVSRLAGILQPTLQDRLELLAVGLRASGIEVPTKIADAYGDVRSVRNTTSHGNGHAQISEIQIRRASAAASALFRSSVMTRLSLDATTGCQSILNEAAIEVERWPD